VQHHLRSGLAGLVVPVEVGIVLGPGRAAELKIWVGGRFAGSRMKSVARGSRRRFLVFWRVSFSEIFTRSSALSW
jgi:hypothetical protein